MGVGELVCGHDGEWFESAEASVVLVDELAGCARSRPPARFTGIERT